MSIGSEDEPKMNRTLDPIRPSEAAISNDMSYLYGRDPSILAYGQRPQPSIDSKKNLYSLYENEEFNEDGSSVASESINSQTVKVYLRLKPFPKKMKLTEQQEDAYCILNSTTLLTKLPSMDTTYLSINRPSTTDLLCRKYTFTETFGPEITQCQFFEKIIKTHMEEFMAGQNCTIMTYGTTNSGKSYTLQGSTSAPGIIPRGLEYVFANINPKAVPSYKPHHHCDVVSLSGMERSHELKVKNELLASGLADKNHYVNAYKQMQVLLEEECPTRLSEVTDAQYSVWVSFAEIYNENIYDLLSNDCQKRRPLLKLATDSQGRAFIKGLKSICVNSGSEAFQVLMAGQYNLKVAATALNARSSRSHCIFTIKLLKYYHDNDPESVDVSTFAFCDLAGSERLKKTLNVGDRLKEAQNINTSLLVLGRCLKSIYDGQTSVKHSRIEPVGPFRESKLTRLFQKALSGKEPLALVVNVNPSPNLYIETQNVLNFAAIAKRIVLQPKKVKPRRSKSRFSQVISQNTKNVIDWEDTVELENIPESSVITEDSDVIHQEDYEELLHVNESLRKQISDLKATAFRKDLEIRQELTEKYTQMMKQMEIEHANRVKDVEEQQEELIQWKLEKLEKHYLEKERQLTSKKRRRSDDDDVIIDDDTKMEDLEYENAELTAKVDSLKKAVKQMRRDKEAAEIEKNTAEFELGSVREELKRANKLLETLRNDLQAGEDSSSINELQKQITELSNKNKSLKALLNGAKDDYSSLEKELIEKDAEVEELRNEIVYQSEKMRDLEAVFESTNVVLTDKTKIIEELEDKLEHQSQLLTEAEERYIRLQESQNIPAKVELCIDHSIRDKLKQTNIIELEQRLEKSEEENQVLTTKIFQGLREISELKEELANANKDYIEIQKQLVALKESTTEQQKSTESMSSIVIKTENIEYCDGGSQTVAPITTDQTHQTSFVDPTHEMTEKLTDTEKELEKMNANYTKIQATYDIEKLRVVELTKKLEDVTAALSEKNNIEKSIVESKEIQLKLEKQIEGYVKQIAELESEIKNLKDNEQSQLDDLTKLKAENSLFTTRENMNLKEIVELKKEIETVRDDNVIKIKVIDGYQAKIQDLEGKTNAIVDLEEKILLLNTEIENNKKKEVEYKEHITENLQKINKLNGELQVLTKTIKDRDEEILRLQKEVKAMLQSTVNNEHNGSKMEQEMKDTFKELNKTKDKLLHAEESNKILHSKVTNLEDRLRSVELLKKDIEDRNREIEELKIQNNILQQKELESAAFLKNRDLTIARYEQTLANNKEELEREKREVKKYQEIFLNQGSIHGTPTTKKEKVFAVPSADRGQHKSTRENKPPKEKDENTSDDEYITSERRGRRNKKLIEPPSPSSTNDTSVVELSGSESKRPTRRAALKSMAQCQSERKPTRKKKLFLQSDESCVDLEPAEPSSPPVAQSARSLRTRRRQF